MTSSSFFYIVKDGAVYALSVVYDTEKVLIDGDGDEGDIVEFTAHIKMPPDDCRRANEGSTIYHSIAVFKPYIFSNC
jgi:hypothetical protein